MPLIIWIGYNISLKNQMYELGKYYIRKALKELEELEDSKPLGLQKTQQEKRCKNSKKE